MVCIICLATIAAVGFGLSLAADEVLGKRMEKIAEDGKVVHETESVATWRGEVRTELDDGTSKLVPLAVQLYKDSGRIRIQIDDHSLSQEEAERLEDLVLEALEATAVERRYPLPGEVPDHEHDHEHAEFEAEPEAAEQIERPAQLPSQP